MLAYRIIIDWLGKRTHTEGLDEMRDRYIKQLKTVHDDLLRMGSRVEHSLADAIRALETWDTSLADHVIAGDKEIDAARTVIEESVQNVLVTQQPVLATDLRTLNATVAIAGELERAGDYAKGIAKRVGRCLRAPELIELPNGMSRLGEYAQHMLNASLDSFVRLDVNLARTLAFEDERVDELEEQVSADLLNIARNEPRKLDCVINLLDVAHTLERVADRSTNIAERVIFIATNQTESLNT